MLSHPNDTISGMGIHNIILYIIEEKGDIEILNAIHTIFIYTSHQHETIQSLILFIGSSGMELYKIRGKSLNRTILEIIFRIVYRELT